MCAWVGSGQPNPIGADWGKRQGLIEGGAGRGAHRRLQGGGVNPGPDQAGWPLQCASYQLVILVVLSFQSLGFLYI